MRCAGREPPTASGVFFEPLRKFGFHAFSPAVGRATLRVAMRFAALFLASAPLALAQAPPGVTPAWELTKQLDGLVLQIRRLTPILDQVKPREWGAEGYRQQHKSAQEQVEFLARSAGALARDPEKTTLALDAFLRLESLERMLDSLSEGVRRYQNPALADLIQSAISENSAHRSRLQAYLVELVATKQDELRSANDEAQNCRTAAMNPAANGKRNSKKP
jgi:hypothetical protein